jgi:TP53 regulating kinase-like protein
MKKIAQGAEAILYRDNSTLIKDRIKKNYRVPELDSSLRKKRTRFESKLMIEARRQGVNVPQIIEIDEEKNIIKMEFIPGLRVRDVITDKNQKEIFNNLGEQISKLHNADIVHGDLTTSNFIWFEDQIHLIDFGLANFSKKVEDKAVDIHLLKQALQSKHHKIWKPCFDTFCDAYDINEKDKILKRLEQIERRGRYVKRNAFK